jgi:hypothetical protein
MMRPGVVWFEPDCRLYVLFLDVWRASVEAMWSGCVYGWNSTDCCRGWVAGAGWVSEEPRAQVTRACMLLIGIVRLLGILCACVGNVADMCNRTDAWDGLLGIGTHRMCFCRPCGGVDACPWVWVLVVGCYMDGWVLI